MADAPRPSEAAPPPVLVTGNAGKLREARRLFPEIAAHSVDLPEIQSLDLDEVLRHKGRAAHEVVGAPVIVEETGLELDALAGFPGPLVKWMLAAIGPEGIARIVSREPSQRATAVCGLLYTDGEREVTAHGATGGSLVLPPRGENGFGWDPIFRPDESDRTYGEMSATEKDAISHRGRAWRAFAEALRDAAIDF